MKAINNYVNDVIKDAKLVIPAIKDAAPRLAQ